MSDVAAYHAVQGGMLTGYALETIHDMLPHHS